MQGCTGLPRCMGVAYVQALTGGGGGLVSQKAKVLLAGRKESERGDRVMAGDGNGWEKSRIISFSSLSLFYLISPCIRPLNGGQLSPFPRRCIDG